MAQADALQTISREDPGPGATHTGVPASMHRHGIAVTADNIAVWDCYLSGRNPALSRAIDIVLSNGAALDERALRALHRRHLSQTTDRRTLGRAASDAQELLDGLRIGDAAALRSGLDRLAAALAGLAREGELITRRLAQSESRIAELESCLDDARLDASTDPLTGVANRRAFDSALRRVSGHAMNSGAQTAIISLDIDHFKDVNDRWGHPVGDAVLKMVAATLCRTVRAGDLVARTGGEEFAIILPATGRRGALTLAEDVRQAMEQQHTVASQDDCATGLRPEWIGVTISAGVSCYEHGEALGAWLNRADVALYRAKGAGRNCVRFGDAETDALPANVVPIAGWV